MKAERFEEIYKSHYNILRGAARKLTGDNDSAHDLVQEVFLKLWNKKDAFDEILDPGAYLYRAVVNASLSFLEKNKKQKSTDDLRLPSDLSAEAGLELKELQARIQAALDTLPPKCRAIFVLSRFEEKKNREIAVILDLSIKTVENQMGIALKKMREQLQPYNGNDVLTLAALAGSCSLAASMFFLIS